MKCVIDSNSPHLVLKELPEPYAGIGELLFGLSVGVAADKVSDPQRRAFVREYLVPTVMRALNTPTGADEQFVVDGRTRGEIAEDLNAYLDGRRYPFERFTDDDPRLTTAALQKYAHDLGIALVDLDHDARQDEEVNHLRYLAMDLAIIDDGARVPPTTMEWISVKDRLPDTDIEVLVRFKKTAVTGENSFAISYLSRFEDDKFTWYMDGISNDAVTHWAALTNPEDP